MSDFDYILDYFLFPLRELLRGPIRPPSRPVSYWSGEPLYRNEWKYAISRQDLVRIRQGLKLVAQPDSHAGPLQQSCEIDKASGELDLSGALGSRTYRISSLYFDTPENHALWEKLDGVREREKFRLRFYNGDTGRITLEKKYKNGSVGTKPAAVLREEEVRRILGGDLAWMRERGVGWSRPLIAELYAKMTMEKLRPKVIVEYTREPYVYEPGNVRVTFDYGIRTSLMWQEFLTPGFETFPTPERTYLMEVKWDNYLPAAVRDVIWLPERRAGAFSKYAESRIYG